MATKEENRAKLQKLRGIIDNRLAVFTRWNTGDGAVSQVVDGLRKALDEMDPPERAERKGRDRQERGGRDRSGD